MDAPRSLRDVYDLWDSLGQFPVVADGVCEGVIEKQFLHFPEGTHREVIWEWLETQHPHFLVGEALSGIRRREDGKLSTLAQQERILGRFEVKTMLQRDHDEKIDCANIAYFESLDDLAARVRGFKNWSQGSTFVHVLDHDRYVVMVQIAPSSCEMMTVTHAGFCDVLTAYRFEQEELVEALTRYVGEPRVFVQAPPASSVLTAGNGMEAV